MKRISTLFAILAAAVVTLTSCKDDFPKVPTTEPYLNMTTSATTVAVGGSGTLKVVLDRFVEGSVDATLTSSSTVLTIDAPSFSIDPSSEQKSFETKFNANSVGEAIIEIESDYPGVRYTTKNIKINIVKPKILLSGAKSCLIGSEGDIIISSDMDVIEDVVINLASSDPTLLTVPASVTLLKGTKKISAKMTGVAKGTASITIATTNDKVEIGKDEVSKLNVTIEEAAPIPPKASISFAAAAQAKAGDNVAFTITSDIDVTEDVVIAIASTDEAIISLPSKTITILKGTKVAAGVYSALKAGKATLSITSENKNIVIEDAKKSVEVTVTE